MTYGSNVPDVTWTCESPFAGVQWVCVICEGAEESAPDFEAPIPPICTSCDRLAVAEALALLGVRR